KYDTQLRLFEQPDELEETASGRIRMGSGHCHRIGANYWLHCVFSGWIEESKAIDSSGVNCGQRRFRSRPRTNPKAHGTYSSRVQADSTELDRTHFLWRQARSL